MLIEDLVNEIHQDLKESGHPETKTNIHRILTAFVGSLAKNISAGAEVRVAHLGTFRMKVQQPRPYFNVASGTREMSSERFYVKFSTAKALKDKLPQPRADLAGYADNKNKDPEK